MFRGNPGIKSRWYYHERNSDNLITIHFESIVMHVNDNGQHRDLVLAESQNLTGPALRQNDEILISIKQRTITRAFDTDVHSPWRRTTCTEVPPDMQVGQHED